MEGRISRKEGMQGRNSRKNEWGGGKGGRKDIKEGYHGR